MFRAGISNRRGFTYLELAVVMLILGVVVALAFPTIHTIGSSDLRVSARHLVRTVYFLADRAAATKQVYRLNFDLDRREYWVAVQSGEGEFVQVDTNVVSRTRLPEIVRFADVNTLKQGKVTLGVAYADFYPVGRVDKTTVHLTDERKDNLTLVVNPVTGRVKIYDGYREETTNPSF
ncbi:MAG TPA: type II secretion system protein [Nitrospiria bacterium]|jgi:general secretion pathway protein H|nr:type II secretion system protein [Nitrospiria bacterium]